MLRLATISILLTLSISGLSQRFGKVNWNDYRHEFEVGIGVANYLGELGGSDGEGSRFSPKDTEFSQFKYGFSLGYRYNFGRYVSIRPQIFYGKVAGSDKLTNNPQRNYRNLAFHSTVFEFAVLAEGHLLRGDFGRGYYRKGVVGSTGQRFAVSAHAGLGFFMFNPKYGSVALQELNTEGQGLIGGPKPYSKLALAIPLGLRVGFQALRDWRIGLDFTYRFTTTDYLDDVSGSYYDKELIRQSKGDLAAEMSDRSGGENPQWTIEGSPRGNPDVKDSYFSLQLTVIYAPAFHVYKVKGRRTRARF